MAKVTIATAQSMRLSLVASVRLFKALIADPALLANGQFTWAFNYRQELRKLVQSLLAGNPNLNTAWNIVAPRAGLNAGTLFNQFVATTRSPIRKTRKEAQFNNLLKVALGLPEMKDGSATAAALRRLLAAPDSGGASAHNTAHGFLLAGTPVAQGSAAFQQAFAQGNLTFSGAMRIGKLSQDRCFEMTEAVCAFITKKGGLHGRSGKSVDPNRVFVPEANPVPPATVPSLRRNTDPALGDLLRFNSRLPDAIAIARQMLDHGHLLNAGVVSGLNADNPVESPDHFLPLLAWEEFSSPIPHVVFAFWDPDASESNDPILGPAFGKAFFVKGADAQQETLSGPNSATVPANFYQNGRFTTALKDNDLRVDANGDDPNGQHRYQVTLMFAR